MEDILQEAEAIADAMSPSLTPAALPGQPCSTLACTLLPVVCQRQIALGQLLHSLISPSCFNAKSVLGKPCIHPPPWCLLMPGQA